MKTFEDQFMDIQAGMVSLAMEYVQGQADEIFIYGIADGLYSFNVFYSIHGHVVHKHQINDFFLDTEQTVDVELQSQLLRLGVADIKKLRQFCLENNREYPTEIWLTYDVKSNSLDAQYSYEGRYDKDDELLLDPVEEFEKWFEVVKAGGNN